VRRRGGAEVAGGGANPAGGDGESVRGAYARADAARDGDGAVGVRTCAANVGACEGRGRASGEDQGARDQTGGLDVYGDHLPFL